MIFLPVFYKKIAMVTILRLILLSGWYPEKFYIFQQIKIVVYLFRQSKYLI